MKITKSEYLDSKAKRLFDIIVASSLLLVSAPVCVPVATGLLIFQRPVLFRHERVARGGGFFYCLKFRTMHLDAEKVLKELIEKNPESKEHWLKFRKLPADPRITRVGKLLRKSSIDELPQLLNVLKGDMSIVGPRPITQEELANYGVDVRVYVEQKPGLTGVWQVSGRSCVGYSERVAMDKEYYSSATFLYDCMLLLKTPIVVLLQKGAH